MDARVVPPLLGYHEAMGAVALAIAVAEVSAGNADEVLVVTAEVDTVYLTRLVRYEAQA